MSGTIIDLNQIFVFVRVVQAGSFSEAARRLGMPKSTVSRRVSRLEERLGVRLLHRTTRQFGLTDAGRVYFERTAPIVGELEEAEEVVEQLRAEPSGLLRVSTPLTMGMIGPVVAEYLNHHPNVQIDMVCTDRRVDLVAEHFDVAIRAGALSDSAMIARKVGTARALLVASPEFCAQHGTPKSPRDLREYACVVFGVGSAPTTWVLESDGSRLEIQITPRLTVNDLEVVRAAVVAGVGIALLPHRSCADDIRAGALQHLLADWCSAEVPVHAIYPTRRQLSPKVVAFIDLVAQRLKF